MWGLSLFGSTEPARTTKVSAKDRPPLSTFLAELNARELSGLSFDGRPLTCVLDDAAVAAAPEPTELKFWQYDPDNKRDASTAIGDGTVGAEDTAEAPRKPKSHRDRPPTPVPDRSRSRLRSPQGLVADYSSDDDD